MKSQNKPEKQGEPKAETVDIDSIQTSSEVASEEQSTAEKFIQRGAVFDKEIESDEKATNIKRAYEGCLFILAKRQLQSEKDDKTKTEIFNLLLEKSHLKQSTVYKRIQFAQALIDENVVTVQMLAEIERERKASSPELKTLLDKRVGGSKGIAIQQKLGYLPSVESKEAQATILPLQERLIVELAAAQKCGEKVELTRKEMVEKGLSIEESLATVLDKSAETVKAISNLALVREKFAKLKEKIGERRNRR